jgi:predicted HTH domain antitoxin
MQITIEIPDRIAVQLADSQEDLTRRFLELLAIAAYQQGTIGAGEVGQLLGFTSRWDTYEFLQRQQAESPYTEADLAGDRATLQTLLP